MIQLMYAEYLKHKLFIVLLRIQQTPLVTKAINPLQYETNKKHLNRKNMYEGKKYPNSNLLYFPIKIISIRGREKQSMFIFVQEIWSEKHDKNKKETTRKTKKIK